MRAATAVVASCVLAVCAASPWEYEVTLLSKAKTPALSLNNAVGQGACVGASRSASRDNSRAIPRGRTLSF
jgi:hypothetical protein